MGLRVLVVEDEMTIAMLLEDMLIELGHTPVAVASRLPQALELAAAMDFDVAILDVNLDGIPSFPAAQTLRERGIPFLFATGYGNAGIEGTFADAVVMKKPFLMSDLGEAISAVMAER